MGERNAHPPLLFTETGTSMFSATTNMYTLDPLGHGVLTRWMQRGVSSHVL